jgi:hypothetical protein
MYMETGGVRFQVTHFVSSFAKNEIPSAQLLIAVGRNPIARGDPGPARLRGPRTTRAGVAAAIHQQLRLLRRLSDAVVMFTPRGEYHPDGRTWPGTEQVLFRGVISGRHLRKLRGKLHLVVTLAHWTVKLSYGSCLTPLGHVANPGQLNAAAVFPSLRGTGVTSGIVNLAQLLTVANPASVSSPTSTAADLWFTIKRMFLRMADLRTAPPGFSVLQSTPIGARFDETNFTNNAVALEALRRFEPLNVTEDTLVVPPGSYVYGRPLALLDVPNRVQAGIDLSLGAELLETVSGSSFWSKLVTGYAPAFQLSVVPLVETAIVIADVPPCRAFWKTLEAAEYESIDSGEMLPLPLRGVAVLTGWEASTGAANEARLSQFPRPIVGGAFAANDADDPLPPGVGSILFTGPPPWLMNIGPAAGVQDDPGNMDVAEPPNSSSTPRTPGPPATPVRDETQGLYNRYAQTVYLNNSLRGRSQNIGGKLRFDIAPGSNLRIRTTTDPALGGADDLAAESFAHVMRVTIQIDAEAPSAGTAFQLTHLRDSRENESTADRTSVDRHPLFTADSIHGGGKHGAPLIPEFNL